MLPSFALWLALAGLAQAKANAPGEFLADAAPADLVPGATAFGPPERDPALVRVLDERKPQGSLDRPLSRAGLLPSISRSLLGEVAHGRVAAKLAPGEAAPLGVDDGAHPFNGSAHVRGVFDSVGSMQNGRGMRFTDQRTTLRCSELAVAIPATAFWLNPDEISFMAEDRERPRSLAVAVEHRQGG